MIATVFDTETTGLIINPARRLDTQPEIISIAIQSADLQEGTLLNSYYKIFKPNKSISEEITKITGFTNDSVSEAPPIKDHLDEIIFRLEACPLIIGQNIDFDMNMIRLECQRYNRVIKWPAVQDLVANTIHLKGYRLSLKNLHIELFGEEFKGAHQADVDVAMTIKCAVELYKRNLL
jgi:DNA polymerase III alpha subunit (gram-positive type)